MRRVTKPTGNDLVAAAGRYVGTPYVWGGMGPSGFDCSGLVAYSLDNLGLRNVPRTSEEQYRWAEKVPPDALQAGDLVFMNFPGESSPGHVMIYAGDGRVIQAPAPGGYVEEVKFKPQPDGSTEWGGTVVGYGRIPGLEYRGEPTLSPSYGPVVPGVGFGVAPIQPGSRTRPGGGNGGGGILGFFESAGNDIGSAAGWLGAGLEGGAEAAWNDTVGAIGGVVDFLKAMLWLVNPLNWLRAFEAILGAALIGGSIAIFVGADKLLGKTGAGAMIPDE